VSVLADAVRQFPIGRPLQLLVEVGFEGGRSGARGLPAAERIARTVSEAAPFLVLRGVAGFEGLMPGSSASETEARVVAFLDSVAEVAEACDAADLFGSGPVLLSAGGSAFYDLVAKRFARVELKRDVLVVVRSGCYLTHDSRMYADQFPSLLARSPELALLGGGPRAALELWAYVQSRPEPERAILTAGKRDCSYDAGLPIPLKWFRAGQHAEPQPLAVGCRVVDLNDQHAFLQVPADSALEFGDMVMLGISHPCTTFDKWQVLPVVDDSYNIVGAIRTFF
jgi:D-serine dehydratase